MADTNLKKHQMEYIGIGVLVFAALIIGINRFKKKDIDDEVFSRTEFNKKWSEVSLLEGSVPNAEIGVEYKVSVERLPFKGPFEDTEKIELAGEDVVLPAITFQGMVWNSIRPQVVVNNRVYDVEDIIEIGEGQGKSEIKIKDIKKEGVYLKYKGKDFIVKPR